MMRFQFYVANLGAWYLQKFVPAMVFATFIPASVGLVGDFASQSTRSKLICGLLFTFLVAPILIAAILDGVGVIENEGDPPLL